MTRRETSVHRTVVAILATVLTVVGGCGWQGGNDARHDAPRREPTMTYQEAANLVEQLIRENTAHLTPPPRLEPYYGLREAPCSGPNDDQETGLVMVERDYWLRDLDQSLNDSIVEQVRRYWKEHGYRVGLDRGSSGNRKVVATHPSNGFRVSITEGQRILSVRSQSTCVAELPIDLTPASPSNAGQPDQSPAGSSWSPSQPGNSPAQLS